jgi:ABC-2 type transport system ATP-binding protein
MCANQYIIDIENVTKYYNHKAVVDKVSIKIPKGIICGLLGPNGSGKTTLMRILCGLIKPDAGSGCCCGYDLIKGTKDIKGKIGYVPQKFSLFAQLTVYENLDFIAKIYGCANREKTISELMEKFHLTKYKDYLTAVLSGGWKQRLAIAIAFIHNPPLLVLDEPGTGIDPQSRYNIWQHLEELTNHGTSVFLTTHYFDEAEKCSMLIYLAYGTLLTTGTKNEIVERSDLKTICIKKKSIPEYLPKTLLQTIGPIEVLLERGDEIYATGTNIDHMLKEIHGIYANKIEYTIEQTQLEECFIHLLEKNNIKT